MCFRMDCALAPLRETVPMAFFFADDVDSHRVLQMVYKPSYTVGENKEIVQELRVAGAGLVWTRIGEGGGGAIYWYDPVAVQPSLLSRGQMSQLFEWFAAQYRD